MDLPFINSESLHVPQSAFQVPLESKPYKTPNFLVHTPRRKRVERASRPNVTSVFPSASLWTPRDVQQSKASTPCLNHKSAFSNCETSAPPTKPCPSLVFSSLGVQILCSLAHKEQLLSWLAACRGDCQALLPSLQLDREKVGQPLYRGSRRTHVRVASPPAQLMHPGFSCLCFWLLHGHPLLASPAGISNRKRRGAEDL